MTVTRQSYSKNIVREVFVSDNPANTTAQINGYSKEEIVYSFGKNSNDKNGTYVSIGGSGTTFGPAISKDMKYWTPITTSSSYTPCHIIWDGMKWVVTQNTSTLLVSYNDVSYMTVTTPNTTLCSIAFNQQMYVGVGKEGIFYSYDAFTWYNSSSGSAILSNTKTSQIGKVVWNGRIWVAVGNGTSFTIAYSYDGTTWTGVNGSKTIFDGEGGASDVVWNGRIFVVVGASTSKYLATSSDGVTWNTSGVSVPSVVDRPTGVTVTGATFNTISISFTPPAQTVTDYTVYLKPTTGNIVAQTASGSPYTATGLVGGKTYAIQIVANGIIKSHASVAINGNTTSTPETPTFTVGTKTVNSIQVNFTPVTDFAYDISAIRTTGSITSTTISGATTSPQTLTDLSSASLYSINMYAIYTNPESSALKSAVRTVSGIYTFASQVIPTVNPNGYYLAMSYNTATVNDSGAFTSVTYTYRVTSGGSVNTLTTSTSPYNLTGLSPSTQYDVSSVVNYANTTSVTYFAQYTTLSPPSAPTNVSLSYVDPTLTVTWTTNGNPTKQLVYFYNSSNTLIYNTTADTTSPYVVSRTVANITSNDTYYAKVESYNQDIPVMSSGSNNVTIMVIPTSLRTYKFNTSDINGVNVLNNETLIYDASLSTTGLITTSYKVSGNGSVSLTDSNKNYVNLNTLTNFGGNISISSWIRPYQTKSHSTIFELGNGRGQDTIGMYVFGNSIATNVINGNLIGQTMNFTDEITPFGTSLVTGNSVPGTTISSTLNQCDFIFVTYDGKRMVIKQFNNGHTYYSNYNTNMSSWGPFIRTYINTFRMYKMALTPDGKRGVCIAEPSSLSSNRFIYYFNWIDSSNNYSNLTQINDNTVRINSGIAISSNGERIIVTTSDYGIFYSDWNNTTQNYNSLTLISSLYINNIYSAALSPNLQTLVFTTSLISGTIYFMTWNGTTYSNVVQISGATSNRTLNMQFSHDGNILYFISDSTMTGYTPYGIRYTVWNKNTKTFSTPFVDISTSIIPSGPIGGSQSIYFNITADGTMYYGISYSYIRSRKMSINNQNTKSIANIDVSNTSNTWRNVTWTISSTGTYKYYLDANLIYTDPFGIVPSSITRLNNYIGTNYIIDNSYGCMNYYNGGVDNFSIFNKELTQIDISNIYLNP